MLSHRSLRLSSLLFILFSLFKFSYHVLLQLFQSFSLPAHLSVFLPQLLCCWFLPVHLVIALFIVDYLLFNSSVSLINISYISPICAYSLFIHTSFLFSRFLIIFIISTLNSFSFQVDCLFHLHLLHLVGFYHVPSAGYFSVFSFFVNLLCLESPFFKLEGCSSS